MLIVVMRCYYIESYAELMAPVILCLRAIISSSEILSISYMTGPTLAMN